MSEKVESNRTGQPLRVLFVEDNPRDVKLIRAVLERSGYRLTFDTVDLPGVRCQVPGARCQVSGARGGIRSLRLFPDT